MSSRTVRITARPRAAGIDLVRLALTLLEVVERLPAEERQRLAIEGDQLLAAAQPADRAETGEGAA